MPVGNDKEPLSVSKDTITEPLKWSCCLVVRLTYWFITLLDSTVDIPLCIEPLGTNPCCTNTLSYILFISS